MMCYHAGMGYTAASFTDEERDELKRLLRSYMGGKWKIASDEVLDYWRRNIYDRMWATVNK